MRTQENRLALQVSLTYTILAVLWIIFSDEIGVRFIKDHRLQLIYSEGKGLGFVLLTGFLLHQVLRRLFKKWILEMEQRQQAELGKHEGEKLYRRLFEVEKDAVFLVDCETHQILDANPAAETMYGYSREELLHLKATDISAEPDKTAQAITAGQQFVPDRVHRRKNGALIVVEMSGNDFEFKGRRVHVAAMRDVSGRKKMEAALAQSEESYRSLFEHMNEGVAHCQMIFQDGRPVDFLYLAVNKKFSSLKGLGDVAGHLASEVNPALLKSDPDLLAIYGRVANTGIPEKTERYVASLQMWFHISVHSPARGFFVAVFDVITERKQMETALRTERDFSAGIINKAPSIICGIRPDGTTTFLNPAGEAIIGYGGDEIIGKNWWQVLYPDDEGRQVEHLFRAFESGEVRDYEMTLTTKAGERRTVAWSSINRRDAAGIVYEIIGFGRDVTESKRQQLQLQLQSRALSAAANAIVITDASGDIEWVNPAFLKLTGYAETEIIGRNIRILNSGEQKPEFYAGLWSVIVQGAVWHGELTNRRRDGSLYQEDMTITPVQDEDGHIAHFIAIKQDITDRRQIDTRLRQAEKMEAIGTLAGGIAHDFNNILAAMYGYAYLLQQDGAGPMAVGEYAGEILKAADRAKDLVQQILTFSRQRERSRQPLQLELVVKEALKFLRASLPAGVKVEMNLEAGIPSVLADPTQIYQVVLNLATNSLHAMEGHKGCLTVSLEAFTPDRDFLRTHPEFCAANYVRLTVTDNGRGIDAALMGRIFEPFFTTKPVGVGTGLGLSVVLGIVQSHEGIINVESQPGRGTTFHLYFPAQAGLSVPPPQSLQNMPRGDGESILLVDDEPTLTRMLQQLLLRLNYQIATCNDPREAVALFRADPARFDLVITDLTMPDLNGMEVARQLHKIRPDVPVILASGINPELSGEGLREAGIAEIVEKPVSANLLAQTLKRTLAAKPCEPVALTQIK